MTCLPARSPLAGRRRLERTAVVSAPPRTERAPRLAVIFTGLMLVMFLAALDSHDRRDRAADDRRRPRRPGPSSPWVNECLPAGPDRGHAAVREARRPASAKRVLQSAVLLFLAGSALCGLSPVDDGADCVPCCAGSRRRRLDRVGTQATVGDVVSPPRTRPLPGTLRRRLRGSPASPGRCWEAS